MMTVPMDNNSVQQQAPHPSKELVQRLYNKNLELENKRRKSAQARVPSDPNAWQQMRENYEAIILEDHAFSEKHEIEYALWQLHYRRIEELRGHFSAAVAATGSAAPGGKGPPPRPDRIKKIRSQFKTFLSEATGFYHDLILKIRAKYGLPFGHFTEIPQNLNTIEKDGKKNSEVKRGLMSCHRCLIYLGDLARYKGQYGEGDSKTREYAAASSYYMQAASLWPSSGNPHHQLAILASYSGDDLGSIYRYFRSLAVNNPFSTARDNLIIAFEKNRQSYSQLPGDPKISLAKTVPPRKTVKGRGNGETVNPPENSKLEATSTKESSPNLPETYKAFCVRFVRLNGILFTRTSLETFSEVFSVVRRDLKELLSSGPEEQFNFGTNSGENGLVIVRLVAILIFTVHNVNRETEGQSYAEILQRSVLLQNAFTATFEIMGRMLERSIQLRDPSSSYLSPAILVFVEWLACRPDIAVGSDVEEKQATARSLFWNNCTLFLNKVMSSKFISVLEDGDETCFSNMSRYDERETDNRLALWEDFELRGFLPLLPAQLILDFSRSHMTGSDGSAKEMRIRIQRILAAGRVLANNGQIDGERIYFDQKLKKFVFGVEPQKTDDFILPSTFEMSKSNGNSQENPLETRNTGFVPAKVALYTEGEEEDEEIVFKPTISEKPGDAPTSKLTSYEVIASGPTATDSEWVSYAGSTSAPLSNLSLQNGFDANNQSPVASFGMPIQNHQPVISGVSTWLADQQAYLVNGVNNLNIIGNGFVGNGFVTNSELKDAFDSSRRPIPSHPFPTSVNSSKGTLFPTAPEAMIPSKFDSVMSSGFYTDSISLNTSSALQANSKRSPVSRPVRHTGPPPGFNTVPPKQVVDDKVGANLKDENPLVDDYSWLDGYHLSSSAKGVNNSINQTTHMYPHPMIDNNSLMTGSINFPFPGKQVPANQVPDGSQKIWHDHQLLGQLKQYQEQQQFQQHQQQFQQVNHTSALLPEQYQGQSLWSDSFFV